VSETDLINGCLNKDRRIQEELYQRYAARMYAVCLRYCKNPEDAQDVLQDGFVKVFRGIQNYRGDGSFDGWLRRVIVNTAIEHYRRSAKNIAVVDPQDVEIEDPSWHALQNLDEKDIIAMLQHLSEGYRLVFNMHVIEGYSHREIAEILGTTEGTSKSQLARAKAMLKQMVEQR
jgi:RNA polymerase sigma-70 factor (ECF subfamily)